MASSVELEPVPAITGTRLPAASMQSSTTRICSSCESVGDSPVVPTGTSASVPSLICQSTNSWKHFSSTPPLRNGVMSAVIEPWNIASSLGTAALSLPTSYDRDHRQNANPAVKDC